MLLNLLLWIDYPPILHLQLKLLFLLFFLSVIFLKLLQKVLLVTLLTFVTIVVRALLAEKLQKLIFGAPIFRFIAYFDPQVAGLERIGLLRLLI